MQDPGGVHPVDAQQELVQEPLVVARSQRLSGVDYSLEISLHQRHDEVNCFKGGGGVGVTDDVHDRRNVLVVPEVSEQPDFTERLHADDQVLQRGKEEVQEQNEHN